MSWLGESWLGQAVDWVYKAGESVVDFTIEHEPLMLITWPLHSRIDFTDDGIQFTDGYTVWKNRNPDSAEAYESFVNYVESEPVDAAKLVGQGFFNGAADIGALFFSAGEFIINLPPHIYNWVRQTEGGFFNSLDKNDDRYWEPFFDEPFTDNFREAVDTGWVDDIKAKNILLNEDGTPRLDQDGKTIPDPKLDGNQRFLLFVGQAVFEVPLFVVAAAGTGGAGAFAWGAFRGGGAIASRTWSGFKAGARFASPLSKTGLAVDSAGIPITASFLYAADDAEREAENAALAAAQGGGDATAQDIMDALNRQYNEESGATPKDPGAERSAVSPYTKSLSTGLLSGTFGGHMPGLQGGLFSTGDQGTLDNDITEEPTVRK